MLWLCNLHLLALQDDQHCEPSNENGITCLDFTNIMEILIQKDPTDIKINKRKKPADIKII